MHVPGVVVGHASGCDGEEHLGEATSGNRILVMYFATIGTAYRRARWIVNPFARAVLLFSGLNGYLRLFLLWILASTLFILGNLYAVQGWVLDGWATRHKRVGFRANSISPSDSQSLC